MALLDTARNIFSPVKLGDLSLVLIKAVMTSGSPVIEAASSSPGVTIAIGAAGQFTGTFPPGVTAHWLNVLVDRNAEAAGVGQSVHCEGLSATAGTYAFETTSETVDTPVTPTDGSVIYIALLVGQP
jgi:hypothetical protein